MNQDKGGVIGKINTPTQTVASGVWSIEQQFEAQSSSIWPLTFPRTTFTNTCRFNDGSTDNLSRTPSGAGSLTTWTFSTWVKRSSLTTSGQIFSAAPSVDDQFYFISDGTLRFYNGNAGNGTFRTNQLFRDGSAYYHLLLVWDTTNSTAADRAILYVNGSRITSFQEQNNPSSSASSKINNTNVHRIGAVASSSGEPFDGYLAETIFVDGQALTPTSFGATNPVTNIWEPIAYTGTYGTNGFKLNYSDSSNLGDDTSGNGNDFTVNNLTSVDQSTDTPSNNFAVLNILDLQSGTKPIYELGNLAIAGATDGGVKWYGCSSIGFSTGKWYCEIKNLTTSNASLAVGVSSDPSENARNNNPPGFRSTDIATENYSGNIVVNNSNVSVGYGSTWTASGDICMLAVDLDNDKFYIGKNGTWADSDDPSSNTGGYSMSGVTNSSGFFHFSFGSTSATYMNQMQANFGSPPYTISSGNADANGHGNFEYTVPTGFFALCTKNLSEHG